jgi:O-acetylhomoserine (thiol)-lyase
MASFGITTKLIHGTDGLAHANNPWGSLKTPIVESAAFGFSSAEDIEAAFKNGQGFSYSRISNPTVAALESRLCGIADAFHCLCVSSGMAALSTVCLTVCKSGDCVVVPPHLFGNTTSLLAKTFAPLGIKTRCVDFNDLDAVRASLDGDVRMLLCETIANPQLTIYDIDALAALAKEKNVIFAVDNSLLTPVLFRAKEHGVAVEIVSTTKAISGGGTSIGGALLFYDSPVWAAIPWIQQQKLPDVQKVLIKRLRSEVFRNLGGCLSPNNAYLQLLGLETLALRVFAANSNARNVALHCKADSRIANVVYAGLEDDRCYQRAQTYFSGSGGCLVLLDLVSREKSFSFMNNLSLVKRATNFCDNTSLIIHPASTIFSEYSSAEIAAMGIGPGTLRLSVGIEDVDDIISDIDNALQSL